MSIFLEPVYLNEKMVLNCAAYLFKGYSLETENTEQQSSNSRGNLKLGFDFLTNLLSPISVEGEHSRATTSETKAARRYTSGGLHMVVLDELQRREEHLVTMQSPMDPDVQDAYVSIEAVLQPVDFFSIVEIVRNLTPLVTQFLANFGSRINEDVFDEEFLADIPKYETVIKAILEQLETDYLKSNQLEMIMVDPGNPERQLGIVDLDVTDYDPSAIRARLTDGKFRIIGKVTKHVGVNRSLSLVQRTSLSTAIGLLSRVVSLGKEQEKIAQYQQSMQSARRILERLWQLEIRGPAYRVMAMSVCV